MAYVSTSTFSPQKVGNVILKKQPAVRQRPAHFLQGPGYTHSMPWWAIW